METVTYEDVTKITDLALFLKWIMEYHPELIEKYVVWRNY